MAYPTETIGQKTKLTEYLFIVQVRPNYFLIVNDQNKPLTLTGESDSIEIPVRFFHRLLGLELTQYNSSNAEVFNMLDDIVLSRKTGSNMINPKLKRRYWVDTDKNNSDYAVHLGDTFERPPETYQLTIKGKATNVIHFGLYLMRV